MIIAQDHLSGRHAITGTKRAVQRVPFDEASRPDLTQRLIEVNQRYHGSDAGQNYESDHALFGTSSLAKGLRRGGGHPVE